MGQVNKILLIDKNAAVESNFKIKRALGCTYNDVQDAWVIALSSGMIEIDLTLKTKMGVNFSLLLNSLSQHQSADCSVSVTVNGETVKRSHNPQLTSFCYQNWYIHRSMMVKGMNKIQIRPIPGHPLPMIKKIVAGVFKITPQAGSNWCWAAVTASMERYLNNQRVSQYEIVAQQLGNASCALKKSYKKKKCNKTNKLGSVLASYGFLREFRSLPLSVDVLKAELNDNRPVGAFVRWGNSRVGHFVIITGISGNNVLAIWDPSGGKYSFITYNTFRNSYKGYGQWEASYLINTLNS